MTANNWEFSPGRIEVNKGDTVVLKITSEDVMHGIAIPEFKVDEKLPPGMEIEVTFIADKAGEFEFHCNVPCGEGHREMTGTLIVNP